MNKLVVFGGLLALVLAGCTKTQKQEYAGVGPGRNEVAGAKNRRVATGLAR